jgi:hypothetical protein
MQKRQDTRNEKYRVFGEGGTKRSLPANPWSKYWGKKPILRSIWSILGIFVGVMRNVMIPSDRARRVVLGTTMEHF